MLRHLTFFAVSGLVFFNACAAVAGGLISEIELVRAGNRQAVIDVSDVVSKYIPIGMSVSEAVDVLSDCDFSVSGGSGNEGTFVYRKRMPGIFIYDDLKVVVLVRNGAISALNAHLILRAP
jgi:hypothetical protein